MKLQLLLLTTLFIGATHLLIAQNDLTKIDDDLWLSLQDGKRHPCLIVLTQQADVSKAKQLQNKVDKAEYVLRALQSVALETQSGVRAILEDENLNYRPFYIVNAIWTKADIEVLSRIAQRTDVLRIDNDPSVRLERLPVDNSIVYRDTTWGVKKVNADDVWALGYKGTDVIIGGQDTGVEWDHPALKDSYKGWDGTNADHNYHWHDAIHSATGNPCGVNTTTPCDDDKHGTHTVGTMTGDDGANEQIGVAPDAKWIACRNMDEGVGTPSTYIECFQWFLAPTDSANANADASKAPHVINNSWGCPPSEGCNTGNFATMETALNNLRAGGCVIVVSAGNSGSSCSSIDDPAAIFEGSFTVGALQSNDSAASFSSRGPVTVDGSDRQKPDICAPGVGVRSAVLNDQYQSLSGTSMAGPHVAGVVALMIDANPSLAGDVDAIEDLIKQNAVNLTTAQTCTISGLNVPNNTFGYGRVDALAAVNASVALPVKLLDFKGKVVGETIELNWETAAEYNVDRFEVERSRDIDDWHKIATIGAQNNSDLVSNYQVVDVAPIRGVNYYRLKMIDIDHSFEYSKVIVLDIDLPIATNELVVSPNPVTNQLIVDLGIQEAAIGDMVIYSALGQEVYRKNYNDGIKKIEINATSFPNGMYFVKWIASNKRTHKVGTFAKH